MRIRFGLLVVVALVLGACGNDDSDVVPVAAPDGQSSIPGIAVTGLGEVLGAPDTMTLTIGVQVTRETVASASDVAAMRAAAVIDALTDAGVDSDDIQTANFAIFPQYDFTERGQRLIGFTVSNNVVAKVRSIETAGATIDAAVAAGGDETIVQGVGFAVEDDADRIEAARSRAWADAEAKATQLADLAGVDLGDVIQVVEGQVSQPFPVAVAPGAAFEDAARTPIQPGQVTSTVQLSVVFGLAQ